MVKFRPSAGFVSRPYNPDGEVRFFAFKVVDGTTDSGIPWRWEIGFAHLTKATKRRVLVGQNFAPAIDPGVMLNSILPNLPYHLGYLDPVALFLHRISPARQALDYGKTTLDLDYDEQRAVVEAIKKNSRAVDQICKRRNARQAGAT